MTQNDNLEDPDYRLLSSISERFAESMTAGDLVSIEQAIDQVSVGLRGRLLTSLLAIEVKHLRSSGATPDVVSYLTRFPNQKEAVLRVFRDVIVAEDLNRHSDLPPSGTDDDLNTNTIIASDDDLAVTETFLSETVVKTTGTAPTLDAIFPVYPEGKGYIVEQEIDRGGMGVVLKVRDEHLKRTLALKVIRGQERAGGSSRVSSDQRMLARFVREAQVTGRLDHPGVVPIHELAVDKEGRNYFTMKYVQGQTLGKVIPQLQQRSSDWNLTRVLEVLIRVCETLAFAHSKGVIHRDLKPVNIMVGEFGEAYVMDWGLAKILGEADESPGSSAVSDQADGQNSQSHSGLLSDSLAQTQSHTMFGDVIGTAYYMPPEQAAGRIDELDQRTDVYSIGAVLYEILTGQSPYKAGKRSGNEIIRDVLNGPPRAIRELRRNAPPELVAIAGKAMSRRMEDRYGCMADMADDLRAYLSQRVVSAYRTGVTARFKKWVVRNQSITIAGLLTLATIAGALGIVALLQHSNQMEIEHKNEQLSKSLDEKNKAMAASVAAAQKEKIARDEVNGLSLMNHSKTLLVQGDATLATLLALESEVRFPRSTTIETLYAAVAELANSVELNPTSRCNGLVWSPDGSRLLSIGNDGTGTVWNVDSNEAVAMIFNPPNTAFLTARFSSDGQFILTAGYHGMMALWDAETGIRNLLVAVGSPEADEAGSATFRPDVIAAEFCTDIESGEHEARIVAASKSGSLHLYNRDTGRELAILRPTSETMASPFTALAVSPDGRNVVVGCDDGHVYVWKDQQQLLKLTDQRKKPIRNIEFSPDGTLFTTCALAEDIGNPATLSPASCWHTNTGELHSEIAPNGLLVSCAEFHPTRPLMALGLSDRTLCLWDLEKRSTMAVSKPQDEVIKQLDFSNSGDRIATVTGNDELMSWVVTLQKDTASVLPCRRLFGHRQEIDRVAHNRSGSCVASAAGSEIRVWSTGFEDAIPAFGSPASKSLVRFTGRGDRIVEVSREEVKSRLWSYPNIKLIQELGPAADSSADFFAPPWFTADDLHVAASFSDGHCRLWDSHSGELQFETQLPEPALSLTSAGSRWCLVSDAGVSVWDWKSKERCGEIRSPAYRNFRASPDGRFVMGQHQDRAEGRMVSFDVAGDLAILKEIADSETCLPGYFSRSGRYFWCHGTQTNSSIAISSYIKLIDPQAGKVLFATPEGDALVRQVVIDDSDTRLLVEYVQGGEHTAQIYSIPDGRLIGSIGPPEGDVIGWSSDLQFVAIRTKEGDTQLWDTSALEFVANLTISGSICQLVCFSADSKYFVVEHSGHSGKSASESKRVSLWSTRPLQMITMVPSENQCAFITAFLPDGAGFWTLSAENQIRLWPLDIVNCAKKHVSRTLTVDEQRMYGVDESRQFPAVMPDHLSSRALEWTKLADRIRLLAPVTAERRRHAVRLIADLQAWLTDHATREETSLSLRTVERLRSGPFDTDPLVLAGIADLHRATGDQATSVQILELAARHPRAFELEEKLDEARRKIAPALVSFRSADALAKAACAANAAPEDTLSFESSLSWASEKSFSIADYLMARRQQLEGHPELAQPILQQLADAALTQNNPEAGPELFLQLAECLLELGRPAAAADVLRKALNEDRFRAPDVWNRWLQISFAHLGQTPQQLLTQLPAKSDGISPEPSCEDSVAWLLGQLSRSQPLRINCGGDRYVAADASVWESDRFFTHGYGYFGTDGDTRVFAEQISNTQDPLLYQSERWFSNDRRDKPAGYEIPVPNGIYKITLGFAEIYDAERSFDVLLEDTANRTKYDPASGAWATADEIAATAEVNDGKLDITLMSRNAENAKISCLQIVPVSPDTTPAEK